MAPRPVELGRVRTGAVGVGVNVCSQVTSGVCTAPTFIFSRSLLLAAKALLGLLLWVSTAPGMVLFWHLLHDILNLLTGCTL